jgi:hypothetical protein
VRVRFGVGVDQLGLQVFPALVWDLKSESSLSANQTTPEQVEPVAAA